MAENLVSFEDEGIVQQSLNYFKGTKDQYYRIRIPDINGILMYRQHFIENVGFMRCLKDRDEECPICKNLDDPITKFKVNVLVYNTTTSDGTLPDNIDFVAMTPQVFKFGIKMFSVLKSKHKKLIKKGGLGAHDLILKCTNEQYQHFDVEDCEECASLENPRLKAMAEVMIAKSFIDFSTYRDRDLRFLTPVQQNAFVEKALGTVPHPAGEPGTAEDTEVASNAAELLGKSESAEDANVGSSIKDLI